MFVIHDSYLLYLYFFLQHKIFQVKKHGLGVISQVGDHIIRVQLRLIFTRRPSGEDVNACL